MPARKASRVSVSEGTAGAIFALNERLNQLLIAHLDPSIWTAIPVGKVRTVCAIFTHVHNVRAKWVRLTAPDLGVPELLNRARCTQQQASAGLAASAHACEALLNEALSGKGRVETFRRDGWADAWPVGPEMLCYMLCHEAHHRGQVCMLAHQLGSPLPAKLTSEMWDWPRLSRATDPGGRSSSR